mmetsp:Transcript_27969/g.43461  ORF Transcript_27969/g.43461 Transcript_27969/m.43461 type:complete len:290 (-) Transcript_27969:645-1514(-)
MCSNSSSHSHDQHNTSPFIHSYDIRFQVSETWNAKSCQHSAHPPYQQAKCALGSGATKATKSTRVEVDQGLLILYIPQYRCGGLPAPSFRFFSGSLAHFIAELFVLKLLQTRDESIGITRIHEERCLSIINDIRNSTSFGAHDRYTAGHGLEHDETKRLTVTRHDKCVGGSKRLAQIITTHLTSEIRVGALEMLLEILHIWTLTNEAQTSVGHLLEHWLDVPQTLLGSQTTDVDHEEIIRVALRHAVAHIGILETWVEAIDVNSLPPNADSGYTVGLELFLHLGACDQG